MKYLPSTVLLFCCLLTACAIQPNEPAPHLDGRWYHGQWQVHCETTNSKLGATSSQWIWARNADNEVIELVGHLEDGFFIAQGIKNHTANTQPLTLNTLRGACLQTLEKIFPQVTNSKEKQQGVYLSRVTAARSAEKREVSIITEADQVASNTDSQTTARIVLFGDSLSDVGALKKRLRVFPNAPYWLGRFSNGPIWSEYMQAQQSLVIQNHAYGGAFSVDHKPIPGEGMLDRIKENGQLLLCGTIDRQVDNFIANNLIQSQLSQGESTIFIIWTSGNDYISKEPVSGVIDTFLNYPYSESGYQQIINESMRGLTHSINKLYQAGARRFVLLTLPDLGQTPIILQNKTYMANDDIQTDNQRRLALSLRLTELSQRHNHQLIDLTKTLNKNLPDADIMISTSAADLQQIHLNKAPKNRNHSIEYKFKTQDLTQTISDEKHNVKVQQRCYQGGYLGSKNKQKICQDPEQVFFWDVVHPSSYTHCWQAYLLSQDLQKLGWIDSQSEPANYQQWCQKTSEKLYSPADNSWIFSQ